MRILLQFPEGLKQYALEYSRKLESEGNEVFISASPTYGACDLALDEMHRIKAEKLVHFGHNEFMHIQDNVEYVPFTMDADLALLEKAAREELCMYHKVGLVTTVQHIHQIDEAKAVLEAAGKEVVIGRPYGFAKARGQILGCDVGSATTIDKDVDCFVYFGGGLFHPLGAVYCTKRPFLSVDPFAGRYEWLDKWRERRAKESKGKITLGLYAKTFGILVSTKNGQHNVNLAKMLKSMIEQSGLDAALLLSNTFDFDSLNNMMQFDAFVNTACPRIATDDTDRLRKPLLSASELMEMLKIRNEGIRAAGP